MTTRHVATRDERTSFSAALKAATWSDHEAAESSPFMDALLGGDVTPEGYAALLAQQLYAYRIIEDAAATMADDPVAGRFVFDELTRVPALEADLAAILGDGWRERISPSAATEAYCERLSEVCTTWAGGFVAHHYTRYMGDLSGGQYIGLQVRKMLGLSAGDDGVRFYRFAGKPKAYKDRYRVLLDAAPWDAAEQDRVIGEVKAAYRLNAALTRELGEGLRHTAA